MHSIKVMFLYYLFMYLFIYLCLAFVRISAAFQVGLRSKVSNETGESVKGLCDVFEGLV